MAYVINDECIGCGYCMDDCPRVGDAIFYGDTHFEINAEECLECGSCVDACPMDAIVKC